MRPTRVFRYFEQLKGDGEFLIEMSVDETNRQQTPVEF